MNARKLCARATQSSVLLILCASACLVARAMLTWLGGVSAARLNHAPNTTHRAQLWHLYIAREIFASRAYLAEDSAPSVASPSTRYEHSRLLRESSCAQGRQIQRQSFMWLSVHRNHLTAVMVILAIPICAPSQGAYQWLHIWVQIVAAKG